MNYLFLGIAIINIITQDSKDIIGIQVKRISKMLLMPVLLSIYLLETTSVDIFIMAALTFSWLGDIALMGKFRKEPLMIIESTRSFLTGLTCFLCAHIFYIIYFSSISTLETDHPFNTGLIAVLLLLGVVVLKGVKPKGILLIGTILYTLVIGLMITYALNIFIFEMTLRNFPIAAGAILFGSSDIVLAFRDIKKIKLPTTYIMFSYIVGQYLIILGIL